MSVRCPDCGEGASYGREIGHRSDCPSLRPIVNTVARSSQDYAIEFGEYMAKAAERYMTLADRLVDVRPGERFEDFDEAHGKLRSAIYEFRKRAEKARTI